MFYLLNKSHSFKGKIIKQIKPLKCLTYCRMKSYYTVLGVNSEASAKEIKSAYYELSLLHHPDKSGGNPASVAKFREITEAYEVLGNPEKKRKYDQETVSRSQYSHNSSYSGNYYKPRNTRGTYTGKTRAYDYDEHYKQHYEDMERRRQAEHEYFKKRWESEFYRRYPKFESYYRRNPEEEREYYRDAYKRHFAARRHTLIIVFVIWSLIFSITALQDLFNPDIPKRRSPIYYDGSRIEDDKPTDK